LGEWVFPGDICFVAETAGGEFAGYVSAARADTFLRICALEVQAEYRGLGLGKALLDRLLEQADSEKAPPVIIDLPAGQGHFSRALIREDFTPCVQRYCRYPATS
jgi:GNAT superfamily N-acetyltransferase